MKIIQSIILGFLAALLALVLEIAFSIAGSQPSGNNFPDSRFAIIVLAAVEEFVKLAILYKKFYLEELSMNIFRNSLSLALGFALAETFFLFSRLHSAIFQKPEIYYVSGIYAVHLITMLSAAYFISRRPYAIYLKLAIILFANIAFHSLYNFLVIGRF
jgi:hypothetical protein